MRCAPLFALALVTLPSVAGAAPPRPVDAPAPVYPAWAVGSGLATEVELRVLVGRDGAVHRVEVVPYNVKRDIQTRTMRASFDSAAVRAVRGWRFQPATRAGRAVSVWWTMRVPFADPENAPEADSSRTWIADTSDAGASLEVRREAPEWPAAVPYLCRGRVTVRLFPGPDGRVWSAHVTRADVECHDPGVRPLVDAAAIRAALRWRYPAEDYAGETLLADFAIPLPRLDAPVIVGCVRDSLSGRPRPEAEILGDEGRVFGAADDSGWFVLRGRAASAPRLRARLDACNQGGFRTAHPWRHAGDEVRLSTRRGDCGSAAR